MKRERIELSGCVFGKLTVVSFAGTDKNYNAKWLCACECGEQSVVWSSALRRWLTTSCGCHRKAETKKRRTTHGQSGKRSATYNVWAGMIKRCTNPNAQGYDRYGGRGIKVCDAWKSFESFFADMGDKPEGHSIERVDNDGDYSPENCVWALVSAQSRNKSNNRKITANGQTMLLVDWAARLGINANTITKRIDELGWDAERALSTPVRKLKPRLV